MPCGYCVSCPKTCRQQPHARSSNTAPATTMTSPIPTSKSAKCNAASMNPIAISCRSATRATAYATSAHEICGWCRRVWDDLNHIGAWIAKDNPRAARVVLERILQTIEQLQTFPGLSRHGRAGGTCERVVSGTPYIIVFEPGKTQRRL